MAKKDERFEIKKEYDSSLGFGSAAQVIVDKKTGVNYLLATNGYGAGLTVLVDREGRPVISTIEG